MPKIEKSSSHINLIATPSLPRTYSNYKLMAKHFSNKFKSSSK